MTQPSLNVAEIGVQNLINKRCTVKSSSGNKLLGSILADGNEEISVADEKKGWFHDWLNDKDKVCTDEQDDGHISFAEAAKSFGKGFIGIVKGAVKKPLMTAAIVGGGIALTALTGGAILPALIASGVVLGTAQIGRGIYKTIKAENDGEAKQAWENIGMGTFAVVSSFAGAKGALKTAGKAGVDSALGCEELNAFESVIQCFKSTPEAIKTSGINAWGNIRPLFGIERLNRNTPELIFKRDKTALENRLRRNLKQAGKNDIGKYYYNKFVKDEATIENIVNSINEDNIGTAKAMFEFKPLGKYDVYWNGKEQYFKYYTETIPQILKSDTETQQLALKIINSKDICNKYEILNYLNNDTKALIKDRLFNVEYKQLFNWFEKGKFADPALYGNRRQQLNYINKNCKDVWKAHFVIDNKTKQPILQYKYENKLLEELNSHIAKKF